MTRRGTWFVVILETVMGRRCGSVMSFPDRSQAEHEAARARKQSGVSAVEYARTAPRVGRLLAQWTRDGRLP